MPSWWLLGWDGVLDAGVDGASVPPGFLGEGDAITKAIQDARQLLHGHSGAMDGSLSNPYRKVMVTVPFPHLTIRRPAPGLHLWAWSWFLTLLSCRTTLGLILPR